MVNIAHRVVSLKAICSRDIGAAHKPRRVRFRQRHRVQALDALAVGIVGSQHHAQRHLDTHRRAAHRVDGVLFFNNLVIIIGKAGGKVGINPAARRVLQLELPARIHHIIQPAIGVGNADKLALAIGGAVVAFGLQRAAPPTHADGHALNAGGSLQHAGKLLVGAAIGGRAHAGTPHARQVVRCRVQIGRGVLVRRIIQPIIRRCRSRCPASQRACRRPHLLRKRLAQDQRVDAAVDNRRTRHGHATHGNIGAANFDHDTSGGIGRAGQCASRAPADRVARLRRIQHARGDARLIAGQRLLIVAGNRYKRAGVQK